MDELDKLKMNTDKTEIMLCGSLQKLKRIDVNSVIIGDECVYFSKSVRNLGIHLDQNLNLNTHIANTRKSCYYEIRNISKFRQFISEKAAIQLDYCNSLFYNMSSDNFNKLQTVQNHAARVITKSDKRSSSLPILKRLHWLPIRQVTNYQVSIMDFKCLYDSSFPSYLKDLICMYTPSRTLRSSSDRFLLSKPFNSFEP